MKKKTTLVFSLVKEQSRFMTTVISILTFLSVLAFGVALAIGGGVTHWNNQWEKYATVQVINLDNTKVFNAAWTPFAIGAVSVILFQVTSIPFIGIYVSILLFSYAYERG